MEAISNNLPKEFRIILKLKKKLNKKHGQESNPNLGTFMTQREHTKDCVSFYS